MGRVLTNLVGEKSKIKKCISWLYSNKYRICATVAALGLLAVVTTLGNRYVKSNMKDVYPVFFADQQMGTVSDPTIVKDWLDRKSQELELQYPNVRMLPNTDQIYFDHDRIFRGQANDNSLVLKVLEKKLHFKAVGVEVRVDGKVLGTVKDEETASRVLDQMKEKYIPDTKDRGKVRILSADTKQDGIIPGKAVTESVVFVQKVQLSTVDTTPEQIMEPAELLRKLETGDVQPTKYKVQQGDCISCIAQRFNISQKAIYQNNPWITNDQLNIGDELDLTVLQPALSVKTTEKRVDTISVPSGTTYEKDENMRTGTSIVVVEGKPGKKQVTYQITKLNGQVIEEKPVNEVMLEKPVTAVIRQGTKVIPGIGTGTFAWPVIGAKITSEFGTRWGKFHAGTDNVSDNRNILAADNGKVILAGNNGDYGNCIIIDHQNGYKTLYAHLSKINVAKGQTVEKGEKIGIMGSTGDSTGVHLHFEIRKGDKQENPLKYLNG